MEQSPPHPAKGSGLRILFSSPPAHGHLIPLLPLARAAREAGHAVALLTHQSMASVTTPLDVLNLEPPFEQLRAEAGRRLAGSAAAAGRMRSVETGLTADMVGELFVRIRLDLSGNEALKHAALFRPDLVIADELDSIGPLIAAEHHVPWASHAAGPIPSQKWRERLNSILADSLTRRGLRPTQRLAHIDPWPDMLQPDDWQPPADRIPVQPQPLPSPEDSEPALQIVRGTRPIVLVTLGTTAQNSHVLHAVLTSVAAVDADIIVTGMDDAAVRAAGLPPEQVHSVKFVALDALLNCADAVICAAGAGTLLAVLRRGKPMVCLPLVAEQPVNAERVSAVGAAMVIDDPSRAGAAVMKVIQNDKYRAASQRMAEVIQNLPQPAAALNSLLNLL